MLLVVGVAAAGGCHGCTSLSTDDNSVLPRQTIAIE